MRKLRAVAAMALSFAGAVAASASVTSCGGGGAEGGCPATDSCGNASPAGFWQVEQKCAYSPTQPTQPLLYAQYVTPPGSKPPDPVLTPVQPLGATDGDWCAQLFYPAPSGATSNTGIQNVTLWHDAVTLHGGTVALNADKTYTTSLVLKAPSATHFTPPCLQMSGFSPSCAQLQDDLVKFFAGTPGFNYTNPLGAKDQPIPGAPIQCVAAPDKGCDCYSTFEVDLVDTGTWSASGGILYENSETYTYNGKAVTEYQPVVPTGANYCLKNNQLTMTGGGGTSLSGVLGLRTLIMKAAQPPASP
jgi:hypothetical protein